MTAPARALATRGWRWTTWPRRTLWPTRDGWWCLGAAVGLGFAAMNTGNNLLYLLVSMLLGLVIVSGMLSEQSVRGLHFAPIVPDEIYAGRPAVLGVRVTNGKRWLTSYSVVIEMADPAGVRRSAYLPRLDAGAEQLVTWETTFERRGRHAFPRLRVATRFPFGLFVKGGHLALGTDLVVFPGLRSVDSAAVRDLGADLATQRRRGRGTDLHNLREYRAGDDPRLVHWRSSAKTGTLLVRELEAETTTVTRVVLEGDGRQPDRLETGLSEAASLVIELMRARGAVELAAPAASVPLGHGREHRHRLLTALALYDPAVSRPERPEHRTRRAVREIRVEIG